MAKYNTTIGMEVHVELKTNSKMFGSARNDFGEENVPNTNIDEVVNADPGSLPVPNRVAITYVQMAGLALNCDIAHVSKFDRKHYFYPDLPKGYQISQYDQPLCQDGYLDITSGKSKDESQKSMQRVGITRIHIEEDTGKLTHADGSKQTLIDLNRAGLPLMELVSEPDITSGAQARAFCQNLQQIFRYLAISDADIEKGQMRCEVNISLYKDGDDRLSGTKVEIKNIGSFRSVEKSIDYEIVRQTEVLEDGGKVVQETRGWDDVKNTTVAQRTKENADDYRYFPEPDIPPMTFDDAYIEKLKRSLPELPDARRARFKEQYGVSEQNLDAIIAERDASQYFEHIVSELREKKKSGEANADEKKMVQLAANYLVSELYGLLAVENRPISTIKITPENFAELIGMVADGVINSSAAQTVLKEMYNAGGDPSHIVDEKNLAQQSDAGALEEVVDGVLALNEQSVTDYRAGKDNALKYLMGQVMAQTKGAANPQMVNEILKKKLE